MTFPRKYRHVFSVKWSFFQKFNFVHFSQYCITHILPYVSTIREIPPMSVHPPVPVQLSVHHGVQFVLHLGSDKMHGIILHSQLRLMDRIWYEGDALKR